MTKSRRISGLALVSLVVLLFATLAFSAETTQTEFKNASWQMVDSDRSPGSMFIGTNNNNTQDPIAYYRLDGTSGSVIDSAGSNDGSTSGSITRGATGIYGSNAFSFDGGDYVDTSSISYQDKGTVSLWYNSDSTDSDRSFIFSNDGSSDGDRVYIFTENGNLKISLGGSDGIETGYDISTGQWKHVVLVWDSGNYKVFIDGSKADEGTYSGSISNSYNTFFGSLNGDLQYWEGEIDEIKFFDRELTSSQIKKVYGGKSRWSSRVMDSQRNGNEWLDIEWNGSQPSGTDVKARMLSSDGFINYPSTGSVTGTSLSEWRTIGSKAYDYLDYQTSNLGLLNVSMRGLPFDDDSQSPDVWYSFEGVSSTVKDFSSTSNSGSLDSAERQDGYSGKAAYFDGSSSFTNADSGTALTNPDGTLWLEAWVYPEDLSTTNTLVDKQNEFKLSLENNGEVWFRTYNSDNQGAGNLPENEWSHVAVEWDSGNSITTYVNGTEVGSREVTDTSSDTGNTVYFGSAYDGTQGFTGYMDEFRSYRNTSSIDFLTNITDFTSPAASYGEKVDPINEEYIQVRHRPENMNSYTVDQTRVGMNSTFGDWRDSEEELSNTPKNRYGLAQFNLSTDSIINSPRIDGLQVNAAIPDNETPTSTPQDNAVDSQFFNDLIMNISINKDNISTIEEVNVSYFMRNTEEYCQFNQSSGFCERVDSNELTTGGVTLMANNYPLYNNLVHTMYGSEFESGSYKFTVPPSPFAEWNLQLRQQYSINGQQKDAVTKPIIDNTGAERKTEGESCRYMTECQEGLYCGDTTGDSNPDTCLSSSSEKAGNVCEQIGAGAKERITNSGACQPSYPDMENRNIPEGNICNTQADCTTSFCYDGNDNGVKTCQTSPTAGDSDGANTDAISDEASSCYFAGQTYSEGTTKDIFSDGITNECANGQWEQSVKAYMDYSDVVEDGTIEIDYNFFNFRNGYDYSQGFISRDSTNDITLEQIRIGISEQTYSKSISGTITGGRNLSGTVSVSVPEIEHTDDIEAKTYLEYSRGGNNYTIVGNQLLGGPHSQDLSSGSCRNGYLINDSYYCEYSSQESPNSGIIVSSSSNSGNLCEVRESGNVERRVTTSGACEIAQAGAENNNLPEDYQCETKEDCISNYCVDTGSGFKTCETSPTSGTSTGVLASPQSSTDTACFYEGRYYQDGKQMTGFESVHAENQTMTCESGRWKFEGQVPFEVEIPDQDLTQGQIDVNLISANPFEYCSYSRGDCNEIGDNFIDMENITFSISDHPPQTYDLSTTLKGEENYNKTLTIDIPDHSYTKSGRIRAALVYDSQGEIKKALTSNVFRGQTWQRKTSGACQAGYEVDKGYFCEFEGQDTINSGTGTTTDSSNDYGSLCKTEGSATRQRVSVNGTCELASPGADNYNLPTGYECREQSDCIDNYCYDGDQDGVKTCQEDVSTGAEGGLEVSDETDCAANSCAAVGQCYANGTTFEYYDQTLTCYNGDLKANATAAPLMDDITSAIDAIQRELTFGVYPSTTNFKEETTISFDYVVWNPREYCSEDDTTGICTQIDSNLVKTDTIRAWFDRQLQRFNTDISVYGGERKTGSFDYEVPRRVSHHDFRSELLYNVTATNDIRPVASRPFYEPIFDRSEEGSACTYNTDCETGLYCGDTNGDAQPDTCLSSSSENAGNVCEDRGSMQERISTGGTCEFSQPGFENSNLKEGMTCRTSQDCVTDYCHDADGDGTKTCQTERSTPTSDGTETTIDSAGLNSCFFAGETYSSGTEKDVNADSDTETCSNGLWQEEIKFDADLEYGFTDGDTITIDYNVHNPRKGCDRTNGFCTRQQQRSIDLQKIVINTAGQKLENSVSGTVYPERNVSGSTDFTIPEVQHTSIMNTRVFLHIDDGGTTDIIAAKPAVRGTPFQGKTSGTCTSAFHLGDDVFCEYDTQEEPSNAGDVVNTGFEPGNLCAESEPSNTEHRVTTSGTCKIAADGTENRNLPTGYECTTEQDCVADYCYDAGSGFKTCQTQPTNGTETGVLSARQSNTATTCNYAEESYENGTTINIFGQDATCDQGRWNYESEEFGFGAEIPDQVTPGETVTIDYSIFNALQYCTYQNNELNCEVIEENKLRIDSFQIEFRSQNTTVDVNHEIAGGQRYDDSVTFTVPDFNYTNNIPITMRVTGNRTLEDGSTVEFIQKTPDVVRGSDWEQKTSASCRNGYQTDSGYYCLYNNETKVEVGAGDVRTTSEDPGQICESPQPTTKIERVDTSGTCNPAQAGAQNQNLPDGYACQNQADCISDYCYDEDMDGQKTCQSQPSDGSASGEKISTESDCPAAACEVRGYCYEHGASFQYEDQTRYCDNGELSSEIPSGIPETPGELAEEVLTTYRDFTFGVFDRVINSGTLDVGFRFTNLESFSVKIQERYITSGLGVDEHNETPVTVPSGESVEFYLNDSQRPANGAKLFYSEIRVTNSSWDINQWMTSNQTCYVANWNGFQNTCIRDDPEIQNVEFNDYDDAHEFDINFTGIDPDGASDVQSCSIEVEHEEEDTREFTGTLDYSYGGSNEFRCAYDSIGDSISGYEPTDELKIIMSVTDSSDKTGTVIRGYEIPNKPPTHDEPIINPEPALSADDLTAYSNGLSDPEGDSVNVEYNWTIDGNPTGWDTQTLGSGNYSTFDWITVYITPSDPYGEGETKSKEIQIQEAEVDIQDINFENYSESHEYNVSAVVNATDPEGIQMCQITASQNSESHTFDGTVNTSFGASNQISCNYSSIDSSLEGLEPLGDTEVEFFLEDENNADDTASEVGPLPNTPPSVTAPTFDPDPARSSEDLTGISGTASDPEGDSVTYNYRWYINGTETDFTGETLTSDNFDIGDEITFETIPYDGYEYGEANNTTTTVTDIQFDVFNLTFTDSQSSHSYDLSAEIFAEDMSEVQQCEISVSDGDGNSYTYTGSIDTSYGNDEEALCTYSSINDSISGYEPTELIDVEVSASTGSTGGSVAGEHRIPNQAPETDEPIISPNPASTDDTLTGSIDTTTDPEGDSVTIQYEWFVNGENVTEGNMSTSESTTLESGNFSTGDTISFNVTPHDPYEFGEMNSTEVEITEGGLTITEIRFNDYATSHAYETEVEIQSEDTSSITSCSLEFSDGNGNSISVTGDIDTDYGSSNQALCTYSEVGSSTSGFKVNEQIDVDATVSDGSTDVSDVATHAIPNSAPEYDQVLTDPLAPVNENDVTLNATITDAESDGVEWANFTITHENGTELVSNENGSITSGEWISPEFDVEENVNYSWTVEAYDSYDESNETGWFTTSNDPPQINSVSTENVIGDHAYNIEFVVNDPDGDFDVQSCSVEASDGDGNSVSETAEVDSSYGNSTEALCSYSSISDSTSGFEINEQITFDLTATDAAGQTGTDQGQQIIPNRAPEISLDSPTDGSVSPSPVELEWSGSDDDGDSISYNLTVATDSSLSNVVHTETTSLESVEVSNLPEGDYYWQVEADDSYTTADSAVDEFTVSATIENVSITLEGDFEDVQADGEQVSTGTYTDLQYPYISMSDSAGLQGLVSYGSFTEAEYRTESGTDVIEMTQNFTGERMLLVANDGDSTTIEDRRDIVTSRELFEQPLASFDGRIPDESVITAMLSYTDIDLIGDEKISANGNTEVVIRNEGTEDGRVQVSIAER